MAIQHLTTAEIKAANLRAIAGGTLAAIKFPGDGCYYSKGCAIGCAMSSETIAAIRDIDSYGAADGHGIRHIAEDLGVIEIENIDVAAGLQAVHDRLAGGGVVDYTVISASPALAPYRGQPMTVDLYRLAVEAL